MNLDKASQTRELTKSINLMMKAFLVAGKSGEPAEGLLPFNPLYFNILRSVGTLGSIRPSQLAEQMSVSRSTMSTALKALQKRQLLATTLDETDKRAINMELTAEGHEVLNAINRQDFKNSELMLSVLHESERVMFVRYMSKIADQLARNETDE